jgi:hypothetical protein
MLSTTDPLIPLSIASRILGVGAERVRVLVARGDLPEVERRGTSNAPASILVRRCDVDRLARDGWPGRRSTAEPKPHRSPAWS